jgi:hypothetical protein
MAEFGNYLETGGDRLLRQAADYGHGTGCCAGGGKVADPATAVWRLTWWQNLLLLAVVGLLIWNSIAVSAMGYGMIQTQPQLEETTGYTRAMKLSTEGAINGTTKFIKKRLAEFPDNQPDIWMRQISDTLASVTRIVGSIDKSVHDASSPEGISAIVHTAVGTLVKEMVPEADKAKVSLVLDDVVAVSHKLREVIDQLTPEELSQGLRSVLQLSKDTDDVVAAIKAALTKHTSA